MKFKVGSKVQWKWMGRAIEGKVKKSFTGPISKTIKGKSIKRNGSFENPAYLVISEAGNEALKLESELLPITAKHISKNTKSTKPTMF